MTTSVTLITGSTWTVPANCPAGTQVKVEAWGGGSGGSGRSSGGNFGAGGAGGAYSETPSYFVTPNDVANGIPYTIGAGSTGGAGANPSAGGGNTSFANNNPLNLLINTTNNGAVVGSPGTNPNSGGPTNLGGLSAAVIAFGTNPKTGNQFAQFRIFGTSTGVNPIISYSTNTITSAAYTGTFAVSYVAGSLTNISGVTMAFDSFTAGFATFLSTTINLPITLTQTLTTYSGHTTTPATTAVGNLFLSLPCAAGAIDITIQIEALQFELGSTATAWKSTAGYTLAQGGGAPSGTTGGVGSATACVMGPNGYAEAGGSGAAYNASGSGGGGAGGSAGVGANGTTAGVGGTADAGGGGAGGAVKATTPGNAGTANALGGGGGGGLKTVAGTGGAGGAPGGGGGGAAVSAGTGGNGANGQLTLTYTPSLQVSDSISPTETYVSLAKANLALLDSFVGSGFSSGFSSGFGNGGGGGQGLVSDTYSATIKLSYSDTLSPSDAFAQSVALAFSDVFTLSPVFATVFTPLMFANPVLSDTAAVIDSYKAPVLLGLAETAAASDTYFVPTIAPVAFSDIVNPTDNYAALLSVVTASSDTVAPTDTYTPSAIANFGLSDTISLTDSYTALAVGHLALSETVSITEVYANSAVPVAFSDTIAPSDLYSGGSVPNFSISDTVSPTDVYAEAAKASLIDSLAGDPFSSGFSSGFGDFYVLDAYNEALATVSISLPETAVATDIYVGSAVALALSESPSVTDSFASTSPASNVISDVLSPTDQFGYAAILSPVLADNPTVSDSYVEIAATMAISLPETLSPTEFYLDLLPGEFYEIVSDIVSPIDSYTSVAAVMVAALQDTPTVTDALLEITTAPENLSDTLSLSDTYNPTEALAEVPDVLNPVDVFNESITITAFSLSDSLSPTDLLLSPQIGQFAYSLTDNLAVSDSYASVAAVMLAAINEVPSVSDVVTGGILFIEGLSDSLSPSDSFASPSAIMPAIVSDTFSPSDSYAEVSATLPTVSVSDSVSPSDAYAELGYGNLSLPETASPIDSYGSSAVAVALPETASPSDTYGLVSDVANLGLPETASTAETYTIVSFTVAEALSESVVGSDNYGFVGPPATPFAYSDGLNPSDELSIFVIPPNLFTLGFSDGLVLSDAYINGPTLDITTPRPITNGGAFNKVPLRFSDMAPGDINPFNFDFLLGGWTTIQDPIASAVVTTSCPLELEVVGGPGVQNSGVTVWLSGGVPNTSYEIHCRVITQFGRQATRTAHVYVEDLVPV